MNMIIAVLSNVYSDVLKEIDADYNANLVICEHRMRWDARFGLLIFAPPPINIISFLLMPILLIAHKCLSVNTVKKVNRVLTKISYFPIGLFFFILFLIASVLLTPIAYLKGLILFPCLAKHPILKILLLITWIIIGGPFLGLYVLIDSVKYFVILYKDPDNEDKSNNTQYENFFSYRKKIDLTFEEINSLKTIEMRHKFMKFISRKEFLALARAMKPTKE